MRCHCISIWCHCVQFWLNQRSSGCFLPCPFSIDGGSVLRIRCFRLVPRSIRTLFPMHSAFLRWRLRECGAKWEATIDSSSTRSGSAHSTEPSQVDLKFETLPPKQHQTSVVAADRGLLCQLLDLAWYNSLSPFDCMVQSHWGARHAPWRWRNASVFELGKRGLRDRNSPTCTLSQNGYGDSIFSHALSQTRELPRQRLALVAKRNINKALHLLQPRKILFFSAARNRLRSGATYAQVETKTLHARIYLPPVNNFVATHAILF